MIGSRDWERFGQGFGRLRTSFRRFWRCLEEAIGIGTDGVWEGLERGFGGSGSDWKEELGAVWRGLGARGLVVGIFESSVPEHAVLRKCSPYPHTQTRNDSPRGLVENCLGVGVGGPHHHR